MQVAMQLAMNDTPLRVVYDVSYVALHNVL